VGAELDNRGLRSQIALAALALVIASCGGDASPRPADSAPSTPTTVGVNSAGALATAATRVVSFLQGRMPFDSIRVADTVDLYVSPEGGGSHARLPRRTLAQRANWKIASVKGAKTYSIVPPERLTKLTTRVGRHFNCLEYPLSSRYQELSRFPHVGTKLEPDTTSTCLQTWNLTLIFDRQKLPPTVIAAVYDQWEW
jgi:hypothetical protein